MGTISDALWFQYLYDQIDLLLVPTGGFVYAYHIFGLPWAMLAVATHAFLFYFFSLYFSAIALVSFFVAHLFVNKKVLATASENVRFYATVALSIVFIIFGITVATGGIEPYQAGIICVAFYILQSRYRTSTLTMDALEQQKQTPQSPPPVANKSKINERSVSDLHSARQDEMRA
eukprot:6214706-Pleurochrysis_carterae.AAC.2